MADFKTPDVYVVEKSVLPPSIVTGATAIPAFVGYTEKASDANGNGLTNKPTRVSSLLEYETFFGLAEETVFTVDIDTTGETETAKVTSNPGLTFLMYQTVQLYFANGGGDCYIVSVGDHTGSVAQSAMLDGLTALSKEDAPTLLLPVDAIKLSQANYHSFVVDMLAQCHDLQDRFAVIDVDTSTIADFRTGISSDYLNYGAAYYPNLETTLPYNYVDTDVTVQIDGVGSATMDTYNHDGANENLGRYHLVEAVLDATYVTLPPSGAVAGAIARTDRDRGVWKAPANVSVSAVTGPAVKIDTATQDGLNVDTDSGKSINAIRLFDGEGTRIWGARTLDGNDNEWRYVPVRRLFISAESDIKAATFFSVFAPNTSSTWAKIRSMVNSYLTGIWQKGGLAGATPDEAFFIRVGLGETMDATDILEGRLNVTVGLAVSRPAEFVTFTFTHKLQES